MDCVLGTTVMFSAWQKRQLRGICACQNSFEPCHRETKKDLHEFPSLPPERKFTRELPSKTRFSSTNNDRPSTQHLSVSHLGVLLHGKWITMHQFAIRPKPQLHCHELLTKPAPVTYHPVPTMSTLILVLCHWKFFLARRH